MNDLNLTRPVTGTAYYGEKRIPYLQYAEGFTAETLLEELARQPHLAPVTQALTPERRLYILSGRNRELLELGATYIGTYHLLCHGSDGWETEDDELEMLYGDEDAVECTVDFSRQFPVLYAHQLLEMGENALFGNMMFQSQERGGGAPWWREHPQVPLCVETSCPSDPMIQAMGQLARNRLVVVLMMDHEEADPEDPEQPMGQAVTEVGFQLGSLPIALEAPQADSPYRRQVLCQYLGQRDLALDDDLRPEELLKTIQAHRGNADNGTLYKVVQYACLLRGEADRRPLSRQDFVFLEQLGREHGFSTGEAAPRLVGQEPIRRQLQAIVDHLVLCKKRQAMGLPGGRLHYCMAFLGAPGTGKTSWARWLGMQMQQQGLLTNTELISVNAVELKGKYVGHTAPKVRSIFEQYGIIILDEAYSLTENSGDSYSGEVLSQLCVELERHGQDRLVIFAGYGGTTGENPMNRFFRANPGIDSRVPFKIVFPNFTPGELADVYRAMLQEEQYRLDPRWLDMVRQFFAGRIRSASFGNCREVRNLADRTKLLLASRLHGDPDLSRDKLCTIDREDVAQAIAQLEEEASITQAREAIGF